MPKPRRWYVIHRTPLSNGDTFDITAPPEALLYVFSQAWVYSVIKWGNEKAHITVDARYDLDECIAELAEQLDAFGDMPISEWATDRHEIGRWLIARSLWRYEVDPLKYID